MPVEWRTGRLGDFIELKRGYDLPTGARQAGLIPVVSSGGISGRHAAAKVRAPGVVTGRYGTLGEVFFLNEDYWPLNTTLYVHDFKGNDPRFVAYFLKTVDFFAYSDKAAVPGVNRNHLHEAQVRIPDLETQRNIARTLSALDDKIELNRRVLETLEAMARALFKSWFVDFDPVRAKMDGRAPVGMDEATAALFPSLLEGSHGASIPKEWTVRPLAEVTCYLKRGFGPSYREVGGVCVLNQKCVRDGRVDVTPARRHDSDKKPVDGRLLELGDVLVNSTGVGTLGRVAQVRGLREPTIVDSHVTIVRARETDVLPVVLGQDLLSRQDEVEALGEGSTGQTELSRERLGMLEIIVAPTAVQSAFSRVASRWLQRAEMSLIESETLGSLRDLLLPRLLSGELRIRDAERAVEAVA